MTVSRRNTLALLGIGTASVVGLEAAQAENSSERPRPATRFERAKFVAALRAFADAVESGELWVQKISVSGEMSQMKVTEHHLHVEFVNVGTKDA